jgi:hypothetical protein
MKRGIVFLAEPELHLSYESLAGLITIHSDYLMFQRSILTFLDNLC